MFLAAMWRLSIAAKNDRGSSYTRQKTNVRLDKKAMNQRSVHLPIGTRIPPFARNSDRWFSPRPSTNAVECCTARNGTFIINDVAFPGEQPWKGTRVAGAATGGSARAFSVSLQAGDRYYPFLFPFAPFLPLLSQRLPFTRGAFNTRRDQMEAPPGIIAWNCAEHRSPR